MASYGPSSPARLDPTTGDSLATIARSVSPGSEVLEFGPGPGTLTRHLRDVGCHVDCIERAPDMAASARTFARDLWEADLDQADLDALTSGRTYDTIVAADVLEHLEDPGRVLAQSRERLRTDGELLLSLPNIGHAAVLVELLEGRFPYGSFGLLDRTHRWFFTRASVLELLRRAGFRVERLDRVTRMPETTEFHRRLDQLSAPLRDELLHHPDALTYQFIVRARVGSMSDEEWAAVGAEAIPPELRFRAKLYWAPPNGAASEDLHSAAFGRLGAGRQTLRFALPDDAPVGAVRFDPAEGPGFVRLYSVEVRAAGTSVLRLPDPKAIADAATLHGMLPLPNPEGGFLMSAEDPFLHLPLPTPLEPGPDREVVVVMDWPTSRDYALAQEHIDTLHLEAQERDARHRAEIGRLRAEHTAAETVLREQLDAARHEAEDLRSQVRSLNEIVRQVFASKGWRALEWLRSLKPRRR